MFGLIRHALVDGHAGAVLTFHPVGYPRVCGQQAERWVAVGGQAVGSFHCFMTGRRLGDFVSEGRE